MNAVDGNSEVILQGSDGSLNNTEAGFHEKEIGMMP